MDEDGRPKIRKPKMIKKNWKFYRRTGAIWTDSYHTPRHIRKQLEKPRKEQEYQEYLEKVRKEHEFEAKEELLRKKRRIKQTRGRMYVRQVLNQEKCSSQRPLPKQVSHSKQIQKLVEASKKHVEENTHHVKDRFYYRRRGSIWTEPKLIPDNRLHLIMNKGIAQKDKWAAEQITKSLHREMRDELSKELEKKAKIREIREDFHLQQKKNKATLQNLGLLNRKNTENMSTGVPRIDTNQVEGFPTRPLGTSSARKPRPTVDLKGLFHYDDMVRARLRRLSILDEDSNGKTQDESPRRPYTERRPEFPKPESPSQRPHVLSASNRIHDGEANRRYSCPQAVEKKTSRSIKQNTERSDETDCRCDRNPEFESLDSELDAFEERLKDFAGEQVPFYLKGVEGVSI
mmetsp:Transcript_41878/g.67191  ORF Transcript_41878/g.67191 Transcript_41878/m.67191 type:complete len:402 (-) Transcript_41878:470-1675(-)